MVLPAVLGALSNPWVLSTIGGILPGVISALTGSPTEEEAKAKVAPERERLLAEFAKAGMSPEESERLADEAVSKGVQEAMAEGGMPEWLTVLASAGGVYGGLKASKWLRSGKSAAAGKAVDAGKTAAAAPGATAATEAAPAAAAAVEPAIAGPFAGKRTYTPQEHTAFAESAPPRAGAPYRGKSEVSPEEQAAFAESAPPREFQSPFAVRDQYRRESVGTRGMAREQEQARGLRGELDEVTGGEPRLPALREQPMVEERGFTRSDPGFTGGAAPMSRDEVAFWSQRLSPRQPQAPRRSDPRLNIGMDEERVASEARLAEFDSPFPRGQRVERRDPYTGRPKLPHEDLEIDPLTGAPVWNS